MTVLADLAATAGMLPAYHDVAGQLHVAPPETQRSLLARLGFSVNTEAATAESLHTLLRKQRSLVPPVVVWREPQGSIPLHVSADLTAPVVQWRLIAEGGEIIEGRAEAGLQSEPLDGCDGSVRAAGLTLGATWPLGYHTLEVSCGREQGRCNLIITPRAAYFPTWQCDGERLWGVTGHVYTLRCRHDWGIGDMTALRELITAVAENGGDVVAINPLHALFPEDPAKASPYWPSSRLFLNPLYLDCEAIPEAADRERFRAQIESMSLHKCIADLAAKPLIDYEAVAALKQQALMAVLPLVHAHPDLAAFAARSGSTLWDFATFSALSRHMKAQAWPMWPDELRHPRKPAVAHWAREHSDEIHGHIAAQWLMDRELGNATRATAMKVGLMRDLAVGVSPDGADAWMEQDALALGVSIGAPPDDFATGGQDWGLPPFNPLALRTDTYRPFIAAVRANMKYAGAMRIDHVMGLQQQFWIPPGGAAVDGAYVRYPLDDLLGILALESERHRCMVIGEDLGTVPAGLRERLEKENVFSMRVFRFERYPSGLFKRPDTYPRKSLAQADTHDLPTLAGYWTAHDLEIRPPANHGGAVETRSRERELIKAALRDQRLIPEEDGQLLPLHVVISAIHAFLAHSAAQLVTVTLEDILALTQQLNVPGTTTEYPNWRWRLPMTVDELVKTPQWMETVAILRRFRGVHGMAVEGELSGATLVAS